MDISKLNSLNNVYFKSNETEVKEPSLLDKDAPADKVELTKEEPKERLTKEQKQEIIKEANTTAAGWATFFGIFSTAYFGLRSDATVAAKYDLNLNEDKKLISQIKTNQLLWTLPGLIPGYGILPGGIAWLFNRVRDPEGININ